jgi:hypothetical protein
METTGTIISSVLNRTRASGLSAAALFDLVKIGSGVPALVTGLMKEYVELAPLVNEKIQLGDRAALCGKPTIPGELDRGQVFTALDLLADAGTSTAALPLICAAIPSLSVQAGPRHRFDTGLLVYDIMGRLRRGDAILMSQADVGRTHYLRICRKILRH